MNADKTKEKKVILSTLWIFALLNYLYCDVLTVMDPILLNQIIKGVVGGIQMNDRLLFGASILMEIPIAMILLSRILKYRANRLSNIISGAIMTAVQTLSLFAGNGPTAYYIFFSVIEISCTLFIVYYAIKWKQAQVNNN